MVKINFPLQTLLKVGAVFDAKNWPIDSDNPIDSSRYNRFCSMIAPLTNEEQDFILELTENFLEIDATKYLPYSINCITEMPPRCFKQKIAIAPLIAPKDFEKNKSASSITYQSQYSGVKFHPRFTGSRATIFTRIQDLLTEVNDLKKTTDIPSIILFDDFIGTGNTAIDCINYLLANSPIKKEDITILSFVSQETGRVAIESIGLELYARKIIFKGISDFYTQKDIPIKKALMVKIENKKLLPKKWSFGYKQSEALVAMLRTPNNTFPIFWYQSKHNDAPFER